VFFAFRRENHVYPVQHNTKQKNATISNNEDDITAISKIETVHYYAADTFNIRAKNCGGIVESLRKNTSLLKLINY
jgi:hypothetical protein